MIAFLIVAGLFIYFGYRIFNLSQEVEKLKKETKNSKSSSQDADLFNSDIPYYNGADSND